VAHVDFENVELIVGIQIHAEIDDALVGPAEIVVNGVDRGVHDLLDDPVDQPGAQELVGAVTAGAARVEISTELLDGLGLFGIKCLFVVLGEHPQGHAVGAVEVGEKGDFGAVFSLFHHDPVSRIPKGLFHHDPIDGGLGIRHVPAHDGPFSRSQSVGLDDHLVSDISDIRLCLIGVVKDTVLRFGDPDALKQVVRKGPVAFQDHVFLFRAHGPDAPAVEHIDQPLFKGILRSHIDQVHPIFHAKFRNLVQGLDGYSLDKAPPAFRGMQHPRVAGREIDFIDVLAVSVGVRKAMIPSARTVDQYFHPLPPFVF